MKQALAKLLSNNSAWADGVRKEDPQFFERLSELQAPKYLWIGCSDSRVPANQVIGLAPGEVFVHRNIANVMVHTDLNCMSVIQFAVDVLKVEHILVVGHYGCGGVQAALGDRQFGLVDNWLRNIRDVYYNSREQFSDSLSPREKVNLLCELNVAQQVANVSHTNIVQNAWDAGQELAIHGWIYDINDGLLKQLTPIISSVEQIPEQYRAKKP